LKQFSLLFVFIFSQDEFMFAVAKEQSEQEAAETSDSASQVGDSAVSRHVVCSISRAETGIDVRAPPRSCSWVCCFPHRHAAARRDYETTQNAFELKKERERLENMLGIVASLRHASLEVGANSHRSLSPSLAVSHASHRQYYSGTLLKQRNVQPIVTVRGADRAFLCYPVGDDKVLVFYVDAAFDVPLRSNPLTASTNSNELSSSNDNSTAAPPTPDHDDEVEADEMTKICADLHQLLIGVKFSSLAASSSASSSAVSSSSSSKAKS
jgi:hypothetical protein